MSLIAFGVFPLYVPREPSSCLISGTCQVDHFKFSVVVRLFQFLTGTIKLLDVALQASSLIHVSEAVSSYQALKTLKYCVIKMCHYISF